jgi:8-oxo-dGTP pyrophosphatase MutT (NUDIX family)
MSAAEENDAVAYRNSRPGKRMGAGALIRDADGRVLVVEPTYKDRWELPGGSVDRDESPRAACEREVAEELGLHLVVGRLLCIEWQGPGPDRTESLMFVFDGGVLPEGQVVRLPPDELASYRFIRPEDLDDVMSPRISRRVRAAILGAAEGRLVELEHGTAVPAGPAVWAGA